MLWGAEAPTGEDSVFFMDNLRQLTWVCGVYYIGIIWHDDKLLNLGGSLLSDEPT